MMYSERDKSRDKSRDRSRDRQKKSHRSPSQSEDYRRHRHRQPQNTYRFKTKRVKFDDTPDIRVFKKEDQPSAKGLSQQDFQKFKTQIEKEITKMTFRFEDKTHLEKENERMFRKEQKDKQKALSQRLQSVQQVMGYSCPVGVQGLVSLVQVGVESQQRVGHTIRINDILGCYYTSLSQIPDQPQFQLLNNNSNSECKIIKFDNDNQNNLSSQNYHKKKDDKPLKGILKMNQHTQPKPTEHRHIDPKLILLLKDIKDHPNLYPKEKMEIALDPYRKSGELPYLTKNPQILQSMLKNIPQSRPSLSVSTGRQSIQGNPPTYPNMMHHTFVPKADKYRTVPCKYYHSNLGCNKIDNCTYIHDQRYAGVPVPVDYSSQNEGAPMRTPQPGMYQYPQNNMNRMPMYPGQNQTQGQGQGQGQVQQNQMRGPSPGQTQLSSPPTSAPNYMMNYSNPGYYPNKQNQSTNPPQYQQNMSGNGFQGQNVNYKPMNNQNPPSFPQQNAFPQNRGQNSGQQQFSMPPPQSGNYPQSYTPYQSQGPYGYYGQPPPQQNQQNKQN